MIRSSTIVLDEVLCAAQGYVAAECYNYFAGTQYDPATFALGCAAFAAIEKIIYQISARVIPGTTGFIGPIPIGSKNIVSYGLALYTTVKVMQLAGLILNVPVAISVIGAASALALAAGAVYQAVKPVPLEEHLKSSSFANRVYSLDHEGKTYKIRIVCNPDKKVVAFSPGGAGKMSSMDDYFLFCNNSIPKGLIDKLDLGDSVSIFTANINNTDPLDYGAYAALN